MIPEGEALCFGSVPEALIEPKLRLISRATDPRNPIPVFRLEGQILEDIPDFIEWQHIDRSLFPFEVFAVETDRTMDNKYIEKIRDESIYDLAVKLDVHLKRAYFSHQESENTYSMCGVYARRGRADFHTLNFYKLDRENASIKTSIMPPYYAKLTPNLGEYQGMENPLIPLLSLVLTLLNDRCTSFEVKREVLGRQQRRQLEREGKEPAMVITLRPGVSYKDAKREVLRVQKHLERMNPRRHSVSGHLRRYRDEEGNVKKVVEIAQHARGGKVGKVARIYDMSKLTGK